MTTHMNEKAGKFMLETILKKCNHYQTDFVSDIELLTEAEGPATFYWCARDCGTNIVSFYDFEKRSNEGKADYLECMQDIVRYYSDEQWYKIQNAYEYDTSKVVIKKIKAERIIKELEIMKQHYKNKKE